MAQYQEWLHYHDVDRHLQARLAELVNELAQLQERAHFYKQAISPPSAETAIQEAIPIPDDNVILSALAVRMNGYSSSNGHSAQESFPAPNSHSEIIPSEPGEPISLALFAQGNLPNFETSAIPAEIPNSEFTSYLDQPLPPIPYDTMALLPEDMVAFFDQHSTTDPQIELPWWLQNLTSVSHRNGPIDQESSRTNRLVQRWLERWGKQPSHSQEPGGNQS